MAEGSRKGKEGQKRMWEGEKALVLASGGLDSTTLLAWAVERHGKGNVEALSVSYGQTHERELSSARQVCAHYGVPLHLLDLTPVFAESDSALLTHAGRGIPHESYAQQLDGAATRLVATYVPFRNGLFLSAAASMALSLGCGALYYGAHADDWARDAYPDCSPDFVEAMARAVRLGSGGELRMEAPFVTWSKADIVRLGLSMGVPYGLTWSCYEGGDVPCGACATCIDRARAFAANGAVDPLLAEAGR